MYARIIQEYELKSKGRISKGKEVRTIINSQWHLIKPYYGDAETMGRKGAGKSNELRELFFNNVLGINAPSQTKKSSIVIGEKISFNEIFENCSISFSGRNIKLSDVVTSSYITDNTKTVHGGNVTKADEIIKFTSSVYAAKKEIADRQKNDVVAVFVLGENIIHRNITEYASLINKKKVPYFLASSIIGTPSINEIANGFEDSIDYFALTKERAEKYNEQPINNNDYTNELYTQISNILKGKYDVVKVGDLYTNEDYRKLLVSLKCIEKDDFESEDKKYFIHECYSISKLLTTATFSMESLNKLIREGMLPGEKSVDDRVNNLEHALFRLPQYLSKYAETALSIIKKGYEAIRFENKKEEQLLNIIRNSKRNIAIIVPKAYFDKIYQVSGLKNGISNNKRITVVTPSKFNSLINYDHIIAVFNVRSNRCFNQHVCNSAPLITTLLYSHEYPQFKRNRKFVHNTLTMYKGELVNYEHELGLISTPYEDGRETEFNEIEDSLESFIDELNKTVEVGMFTKSYNGYSYYETTTVRVAKFETGETAFFTKQYKAYVFDEMNNNIIEKKTDDIREGDSILFIRSDDNTRDIVDKVIARLLEINLFPVDKKEKYEKSKYWKKALIEYKEKYNLKTKELFDRLKWSGLTVEMGTIRNWMDEDSHIVGPNDANSIKAIGKCIRDKKLEDDYEDYFNACREIRKIRGQILNKIGQTLINRMMGIIPKEGDFDREIYESVESAGVLLEVTCMIDIEKKVPVYMVNRPLKIGG